MGTTSGMNSFKATNVDALVMLILAVGFSPSEILDASHIHRGRSLPGRHMGLQASIESKGPIRAVAVKLIRGSPCNCPRIARGTQKSGTFG